MITHNSDLNLMASVRRMFIGIQRYILRFTRDRDAGSTYDSDSRALSPVPLAARQLPITLPLGLAPESSTLSIPPQSAQQIWLPEYCNRTDLGNARRMVRLHGADLRYCGAWKRWLIWGGTRWSVDDTGAVERRAKDTVSQMYLDASSMGDGQERTALVKWALHSESRTRLVAMIDLAKSEPGVAISPDQLDHDPMLLNVKNGTLDLRTGSLRQHRREDLITKLAPVTYDVHATPVTWDRFLEQIMSGNDGLIRFLQKAVGYALTGDTSEQVMFILYGEGANGKSTFLNTLFGIFGDYALQTPIQTLVAKRGFSIPNDLARLEGARLVAAAEAEDGQLLAESLVKQLTGQDRIPARYLYGEWFEFTPAFKIFLATNDKPEIRGTNHAIWRRIRLIPFEVTIPESRQDKHLAGKLQDELPGVLNWAIDGCLAWQKEGLGVPPEVKAATEGYRNEMDQVGRFLGECCVQQPAVDVRASELYQAYQAWCEASGEEPLSGTAFGRELGRRGFKKKRDGRGYRYVALGLSPQTDEEEDEDE